MPSPRHTSLAMGDLLDILPDAVLMVDAGGCISYVNPAVRALLGYTPDEILGQPLSVLVPHDLRERHEALVAGFRRDGPPMMMGSRPVLHAVHRGGHLVPVSISLCSLSLGDGERVSVAVVHNVSALNTRLDRATAQAETDALTGLGNRLRLSRRIQAQRSCARPFALLCLDLERVKPPSEVHDHEVGDEALRIVGQRLQAQVRDADLVVRLSGDEFVLLLDGLSDALQLRERALSVAHSLARPLRLGAASGALGLNIGGAISPHHGTSAQALLAAAGQAKGRAKQVGEGYRLAGEV
jgi:diguanylate cyclase (GGDEF)-like protein/PAS domain S-box-containing protein